MYFVRREYRLLLSMASSFYPAKRINNFSGLQAKLEGSYQSFPTLFGCETSWRTSSIRHGFSQPSERFANGKRMEDISFDCANGRFGNFEFYFDVLSLSMLMCPIYVLQCDLESQVYSKLSTMLQCMEAHNQSVDVDRVNDLIKVNLGFRGILFQIVIL